jgi:hypothetical protein
MNPPAGKYIINGAPSQLDRSLRALRDEYARVDERSFLELLDFATRFGGLIYFYNLEDERDGDWVDFFQVDPTMALASIQAINQAELEALFHQLQREAAETWGADRAFRRLRDTLQVILRLARQVDAWLRGAMRSQGNPISRQLQQLLTSAVEGELGEQLRTLKAYDEGAGLSRALGQPIGLDYSGLLPLWTLERVPPDGSIYQGVTREQRVRGALPRLGSIFNAFLSALSDIQEFARAQLPAALEGSQHAPQVALYIAFVRLFQKAQDTLNTLSRRYARFYYRDILRDRCRPASPDSTYLTLTLADDEAVRGTTVPRGTLFSAGQDSSGQDILYASDKALTVTRANLAKLCALRVICGPLLPESSVSTSRVIQEILASEMPVGNARTEEVSAGSSWATFGEDRVGKTASAITESATLGFAIASPYLLLSGGEREVALGVTLTESSARDKLAPLLHELSLATKRSECELLQELLENAFSLYVSTAAGWLPVQGFTVDLMSPAESQWNFSLRFNLPASVPPIVAYDPEGVGATEPPVPVSKSPFVVATNPAPSLPTLKVYLREEPVKLASDVRVHPLSLLAVMETKELSLHVKVSGLTDFQVENTDGEVDTSTPFPLFGALPVAGSYMQLRHPELFVKRLKTFALDLTWFDLPRDATGFTGYYRDYVIGPDGKLPTEEPQSDNQKFQADFRGKRPTEEPLFDNQKFQADLQVRNPGTWKLQQQPPLCLFRTEAKDSGDGPLRGETLFDDLTVERRKRPDYYDPALSSIRLELTAPSYAFGNSIYPQNVLNAVIEDLPAQLQSSQPKTLRYPNPPYLPQLQRLGVNYSASCTLSATEPSQAMGMLFHLAPFGGYRSLELAKGKAVSLLPRFTHAGNLYLGLSGLIPPQTLTLLFQMSGAPGAHPSGTLPPVTWDYLSANHGMWSAAQLRADSTNGLRNTGIVDLELPSHRPPDNTFLPSGFQWLRAAVDDEPARILGIDGQKLPAIVDREPDSFRRTVAITPHVVLASWQPSAGTGAHLGKPLPPHTITTPVDELPGIATVDQPMASFGGRPPETEQSFEIRVGERLRHKSRGILGWDYERLVLERFPAIWKVQVLPAHSPQKKDAPGHVLVVVVPGQDGTAVDDPTVPQAAGDMLSRIQDWLRGLISPFIRLHVVNPLYVRIRVSASVMFRDEEEPGSSLQRLNDDLVAYLSPWFYDAARATRGGQYASEADISEFIQTRPYVAAVDTLTFQYTPKPSELGSDWYFLTSAETHDLTLLGAGAMPGEPECLNS